MTARILLLPGFACTSDIWLPVRQRLAACHTLTLIDWPPAETAGFEAVADFSAWLELQTSPLDYDLVAGHSMGGLIALDWLARYPQAEEAALPTLALVESFLQTPPPLFRNLLMPDADPRIAQPVNDMLHVQRGYYSPALLDALREVDVAAQVSAAPHLRVFALYGDRGCQPPDEALQALDWPADLKQRIPVTLAARACHFPMLENPKAVADWLEKIVEQAE